MLRQAFLLAAVCQPTAAADPSVPPTTSPSPPPAMVAAQRVSVGQSVERELVSKGFSPVSFAVARKGDFALSSDRPVSPVINRTMSGEATEHVLEGLEPDDRIELETEVDTEVRVTPLPAAPDPIRITLGKPVEVLPKLPASGDPRGAFVDVELDLKEPQFLHIESRPVTRSKGGALRVHEVSRLDCPELLVGALMQNDSDLETEEEMWMLDAGRCVLRIRTRTSALECQFPDPPSSCARAVDPTPQRLRVVWTRPTVDHQPSATDDPVEPRRPADHIVGDSVATLVALRAPEPTRWKVDVEQGADVVVRWSPKEASLGYAYRDNTSYGWLHRCPMVFARARFDQLELTVHHTAQPQRVEVSIDVLAPPPAAAELAVGGRTTVRTKPVARDDPRGPQAEVLVPIAVAGEYVVGASFSTGDRPEIEMFALRGRVHHSNWNHFEGPDTVSTRTQFVVAEPGEFAIRIDGVGAGPERELELELTAATTPPSP